VAFDAEFAPNYIPGENGLLSIIQIATEKFVAVVFMNRIDSSALEGLWKLFESQSVLKIGHSFKSDLRSIMAQVRLPKLHLRNYIDIPDLFVELTGFKSPALDKICAKLFSELTRQGPVQV
jgi:ribonuclease D